MTTTALDLTSADNAVPEAIDALHRLAQEVLDNRPADVHDAIQEDVDAIRRVLDTARDTDAIRTVIVLDEIDRQTGRDALGWREIAIAHAQGNEILRGKLDGANACWQRAQAELDTIRGDRP